MFICKFLGERLKKNTGSIVNITDIYAESGLAKYVTYAAAKAGLLNMTKSLASELAPEVLVNSVAPGEVETEILSDGTDRIVRVLPLRRLGQTELGHNNDSTGINTINIGQHNSNYAESGSIYGRENINS